jgi:hypothetical protein
MSKLTATPFQGGQYRNYVYRISPARRPECVLHQHAAPIAPLLLSSQLPSLIWHVDPVAGRSGMRSLGGKSQSLLISLSEICLSLNSAIWAGVHARLASETHNINKKVRTLRRGIAITRERFPLTI